jgi:tRNA pseudouridine55 synthase
MNKPQSFTSFDVIGKLRGILHMRRLGHTGTLDPMATGVLPVLVGTAARACDILPDQRKEYRATVQFGMATDTLDIWGKPVATYPHQHVTQAALETAIPAFLGTVAQLPPMYSAVSVGGRRLYELARQGLDVARPSRMVQIFSITLEAFDEAEQTAQMTISCGKGTYIRTLLSDLGKALGGDGVMTGLCRTQSTGFTLSQSHTFAEVEAAVAENRLTALLIPTETLFAEYPQLHLNGVQTRMYRNGVKLDLERLHGIDPAQQQYTVYGADGVFIGTASADFTQKELRIGKNFSER